jgi:hypothetical protein
MVALAQEQPAPGVPASRETSIVGLPTGAEPTGAQKETTPAPTAPGTDVVLLLDCSGKMKMIDPRDFRKPAAKLFISLLEEDDNVSIIGFGDTARELAPLTRNSLANRQKLFSGVDNISSKDFNTNITEAIQRAFDKLQASPRAERVIILLSDGAMDLGSPESTAEAYKQLKQLLPQVAKAGIKIYCIAFTELAHMELLEEVATTTSGTAALAASDKDLHGIFASIFEKIKSPDSIPLKGDSFVVDNTIQEAILLITKKPGTSTALTDPKKKIHTRDKRAKNITWYETSAFDMITISTPEIGAWKVRLSSTDGNKVYVITDLKLKTSFARDAAERGEKLILDAWLEKQATIAHKKELLEQVVFSVEVTKPDGNKTRLELTDKGLATDNTIKTGIYTQELSIESIGEYALTIKAEGKTFQREKTFKFRSAEPTGDELRKQTVTAKPGLKPEPQQPEQVAWGPVLVRFGIINFALLLLGGALYGGYWLKKRMMQSKKVTKKEAPAQKEEKP